MAFAEDLTVFFDTVNGFAETILYQGVNLSAIFDEAFFPESVATVPVDSTKPACLVRAADVPDVEHGHVVKRGTVTYHVVDIRHDGAGLTLLILEKQ